MHDCQSSRTARLCGVIFTGLMLIGLLVPHAFASPGDDALEDRIEAREAGGQATVEGRTNDRLGELSRRNAQDRSSLRGGQEGDSLLDDPETARFFDKMPADILAIFADPDVAAAVQDSVEATSSQRPRPAPEYLFSEITGAELNGMPVVDFQITDEFGLGIEGLAQGENVEFSFTVNKLVPGSGGELTSWSTYMLADDEGMENVSAGTYADGTLEELGGGNYSFTFNDPLEAISGVAFEPDLTHRVGMEVRDAEVFGGEPETFDTAFNIVPATGETEGIPAKSIVEQENCTSCHGNEEFAFHGGARRSVEQCVSCHQPGKIDGGGINASLDFATMVHKIHAGENLTQNYEFCGFGCERFGAPPDNFNHVVYPQSTKNCATCHNPENPATPQASNIDSKATAQVCASCHDDLAFDETGLTNANRNHIGLAQPNETCEACHSPTGLLQGNLAYHVIESQVQAQQIAYNILDVSNTGEGMSPIVTFEVVNPLDGTTYDLMSAPAFNSDGTSVNMTFGWPTVDFTNVGNDAGTELAGSIGARTVSIRIAGPSGPPGYVTDNGDGTYTLDTGMLDEPVVIPSTMPPLGSGQVAIEGHPAADLNGDGTFESDIPVTNVVQAFAITDATPTPRREVVSLAKCQTCHNVNDGLALHGGNRTDNVQNCVACHNPNGTDINRRPDDPDGTADGVNMAAVDGLEDQSISMQYMIHAIHSASVRTEPYVAYGFRGSIHDYSDASYPRSPADCQACHDGDTYTLPLASERLAVTVNTGATATESGFVPSRAVAEDPTDDNNVSPESAACLSCHTSDIAKDHMAARSDSGISFGNGWLMNPDPIGDPDTQAFIDTQPAENCSFCHSESGFVPVGGVHGVTN